MDWLKRQSHCANSLKFYFVTWVLPLSAYNWTMCDLMRRERKLISPLSHIKKKKTTIVFGCSKALFQEMNFNASLMSNFCNSHRMLKIHFTIEAEKELRNKAKQNHCLLFVNNCIPSKFPFIKAILSLVRNDDPLLLFLKLAPPRLQ